MIYLVKFTLLYRTCKFNWISNSIESYSSTFKICWG